MTCWLWGVLRKKLGAGKTVARRFGSLCKDRPGEVEVYYHWSVQCAFRNTLGPNNREQRSQTMRAGAFNATSTVSVVRA